MAENYQCQTHGPGRVLQKARRVSDWEVVPLSKALAARKEEYICHNETCREPLHPKKGVVKNSDDYYRRGHFCKFPTSKKRYKGRKKVSQSDSIKENVVVGLQNSDDFDYIFTGLEFITETYDKGGSPKKHKYPIDIFARREGSQSIDILLHIVQLHRLSSAGELYRKVREIGYEDSQKDRFIVTSSGEKITPQKKVYQNFIVLREDGSFRPNEKGSVELVPTIYNFINYFTQNSICFFDPATTNLQLLSISNPQSINSCIEHDPRKVFSYTMEDLLNFTFEGKDLGELKKEIKGLKPKNRKYSVNITNWKLAVPKEIEVDENGRNISPARRDIQFSLPFKID